MPLNHTLCAMFMFRGFIEERANLCQENRHARERIESQLGAGGEIQCAQWISDTAKQVVKVCDETYMSKDGPGIWYYDIAEDLGKRVAENANKGPILADDIVKYSLELTTKWVDAE